MVYFSCGKYGHLEKNCPKIKEEDTDREETRKEHMPDNGIPIARPEVTEEFGPGMLVQRQQCKPSQQREEKIWQQTIMQMRKVSQHTRRIFRDRDI